MFFRHGIIAESPRNRFPHCRMTSCSRHTGIAIPARMSGFQSRGTRREWGVSQRNEYGSVGCVSPVASSLSRWHCVRWQWSHSATPASARSHHGAGRHALASRQVRIALSSLRLSSSPALARASGWDAGIAQMQSRGLADTQASIPSGAASACRLGHVRRVRFIRRRRRGAPLHRRQPHRPRQPVVRAVHEHGPAALRASRHRLGPGAFVRKLRPARSGPQVGAIAVMGRRGGGHVGIISGIDANGNPIMVSGNNRNRVGGSADFARPDLRLRDADGLRLRPRRRRSNRRRCGAPTNPVANLASRVRSIPADIRNAGCRNDTIGRPR